MHSNRLLLLHRYFCVRVCPVRLLPSSNALHERTRVHHLLALCRDKLPILSGSPLHSIQQPRHSDDSHLAEKHRELSCQEASC